MSDTTITSSPSSPLRSVRRTRRNPSLNAHSLQSLRSPSHTPHPPRFLRWSRFLFYAVAAPTFLYSLYVQVIVLKGPGRIPLPASVGFGRDTVFLTFHGNFHCTWYACLCLLNAFLALATRPHKRRSRTAKWIEQTVHRFTCLVFPIACFVGLAYYLIIHFHPLNRLRAQFVPDHDSKMALLHLNPLLFALFDALLKDAELLARYGMKQRRAVRAIIGYGTGYFSWTVFCTRLNGGHWPYPFQYSFSAMQHVAFLLFALITSTYLTRAGFRLHGRLDRRRRRRIAAAAEKMKARAGEEGPRTRKSEIAKE